MYFTGDDDRDVHGSALPGQVDRDVKRPAFADGATCPRMYQGKSYLNDHLHRTQGLQLTDHLVQSSGSQVEAGFLPRFAERLSSFPPGRRGRLDAEISRKGDRTP